MSKFLNPSEARNVHFAVKFAFLNFDTEALNRMFYWDYIPSYKPVIHDKT